MRYIYLLPLALLLGCATTDQPAIETPGLTKALNVSKAFDVPALVGMNADQIAQPLTGQSIRPDHDLTPRTLPSGSTEALYTYWRDTMALAVSYDPTTLRVNSFFIKTRHGLTPDYATLLRLANVSRYDKRLSVEPIASVNNPRLYTGVKLVPLR
ncbi:hypothetical protein [Hymenobacter terrenus]|uniref:hypothetical protein n=1 Tax=Hymenobacter terrenus TaxID=1629124 RepID=UPI000619BCA3|nr:hypothetical protein [Hymenobacter terrenus]